MKCFTYVLSKFDKVVGGATMFSVSALSLAEYILTFEVFYNNIFYSNFTDVGWAICKTNGSIVYGLWMVFPLFWYHRSETFSNLLEHKICLLN